MNGRRRGRRREREVGETKRKGGDRSWFMFVLFLVFPRHQAGLELTRNPPPLPPEYWN